MISAALAIIKNEAQRDELSAFYRENKNRLYRIAYSKLHNRADAEDAVQETFSCIADKPDKFFSISQEKKLSYADVITRNIACDMYKRRQRESAKSADSSIDKIDSDISLSDILFDEGNAKYLIDFIRSMPDGKKNVLLLNVVHKKRAAEISLALNISEETVRKRLSDAKKMIKDFLERSGNNG